MALERSDETGLVAPPAPRSAQASSQMQGCLAATGTDLASKTVHDNQKDHAHIARYLRHFRHPRLHRGLTRAGAWPGKSCRSFSAGRARLSDRYRSRLAGEGHSPESIVGPIERHWRDNPQGPIRQIHVFPFGGLQASSDWLVSRGSWRTKNADHAAATGSVAI